MQTGKLKVLTVAAVMALGLGLAACGGGSSKTAMMPDPGPTVEDRQAMQRADIKKYITEAETAVAKVNNMATDAEVSAAESAIAAARMKIADAADVPMAEKTANTGTVDALANRLMAAKTARMTYMDDKKSAADKAMMATARKLHAGIVARVSSGSNQQNASYAGANNDEIAVIRGTTITQLKEDKKAMVAALHGWTGKRYMHKPTGGGMYEAVVYSNVEPPKPGKKFGHAGAANDDYEYQLTNGMLAIDTSQTAMRDRVGGSSFDQSAGVKAFDKGANEVAVMISGTYHGVSGTFSCTPTTGNKCAAQKTANGFNLGQQATADNAFTNNSGGWMFKPADAMARVMSMMDTAYASYGWWLYKSADGKTYAASAFLTYKGNVPDASGFDTLNGKATYRGGAAGKYALQSSTGGTNDAGHFTARATFEADFNADMISGTIDNFMGADGKSRDWSVKLNKTDLSIVGGIDGQTAAGAEVGTVWTIGDSAAAKSGQWRGALRDGGADGVPKVGVGTFYSTYGDAGKMVGGFGVNKQ